MEQPRVEDLIELLESVGRNPHDIIKLLSSIIQQQMMYGGSLEDKLNYHIALNKKGL